jgi:hypothetical protein
MDHHHACRRRLTAVLWPFDRRITVDAPPPHLLWWPVLPEGRALDGAERAALAPIDEACLEQTFVLSADWPNHVRRGWPLLYVWDGDPVEEPTWPRIDITGVG